MTPQVSQRGELTWTWRLQSQEPEASPPIEAHEAIFQLSQREVFGSEVSPRLSHPSPQRPGPRSPTFKEATGAPNLNLRGPEP